MTKEEAFSYLLSNMSKLSHENQQLSREGKNKSQRLCITLRAHDIDIPDFNHMKRLENSSPEKRTLVKFAVILPR